MKKKMGIVLCAICMMTALFSFGIVYAADEGTESPQEPAVVERYADPGEETVVVNNQEELHDAIDQANALGAAAIEAGVEMEPMTIELTSDIRFDSSNQANVFELTAGSNVRIEGNGHIIAPSQTFIDKVQGKGTTYRIFSLSGASLTMDHLILDGQGSESFTIIGVNLQASPLSADGVRPLLILNEGTEIRNMYFGNFGAVTNNNGDVIMNGGSIHDNVCTAYAGGSGAVSLRGTYQNTLFQMNGGEIYNNSSTHIGGAISNLNTRNENKVVINGGHIYGNVVYDKDDLPFGNDGTPAYGGAIAIAGGFGDSYPILQINGGTISQNTARGGGAIYASHAKVEMTGGEITGNKAVIDVVDDPEVTSGEGGGAITLVSGAVGTISGGTIYDNYSDLSGGAIQVSANSQLTIQGGEIYDNVAETHGGAICVADMFSSDQETRSVLTIEHAILRDNVARSMFAEEGNSSAPHSPGGGAIYAHEFCEVYLKDGAQLLNNRTESTGNGGAVYICFGGLLQMDGGIIENNTSANHGGAVYLEGADSYAGIDHGNLPDDGYAGGSLMRMNDGRIRNNHAHGNGGGIYAEGDNRVEETWYRGGACLMNGGVITGNQADLQGGGVYLESEAEGERSSSFHMNDGALYFNVAGEDGNTSSAADMAGAELYSEGGNTHFSVRSAEEITSYLHDEENRYVPQEDREVWFDSWYDDYSDQDEMYGKQEERIGSGTHSGRYMSSQTIDRMAYAPQRNTNAYKALILDRSTTLTIAKTVSGEGIQEETYTFTIEAETPAEGGEKYPVAYEGDTENEAIGTLSDGRSYIRLEEGKATIQMKAGEQLTIGSLPVGCKVTVTEVDAGAAKDTTITVSGTEEEATIDEGRRSATVTTITKWENAKEEVQTQVRIDNVYEKDTEEPIPPVDEPKEPSDEPGTSETETPDRPKTDAVVLSSLLFGMALLSGSIVIVLKKKKALR